MTNLTVSQFNHPDLFFEISEGLVDSTKVLMLSCITSLLLESKEHKVPRFAKFLFAIVSRLFKALDKAGEDALDLEKCRSVRGDSCTIKDWFEKNLVKVWVKHMSRDLGSTESALDAKMADKWIEKVDDELLPCFALVGSTAVAQASPSSPQLVASTGPIP